MADIFTSKHAIKLFNGKKILMLGDSNMRATYKDLITLINKNLLIDVIKLRKRGEPTYENDKRIRFSGLIVGRQYVEVREFNKYGISVEYQFITKCYTDQVAKMLDNIKSKNVKQPDVIIMNSCLWDITRWGPNGVDDYKVNMMKLMKHLNRCLPQETLFIWLTTFPVSTTIRGGLLFKQIDFMQSLLRFEIMEANLFCRHLVVTHGYDVLDAHFHLRMQLHRRLKDGVHFGPHAVRFVSNLLLTHIALSWGKELPGIVDGISLKRMKDMINESDDQEQVKLPKVPDCLLPLKSNKNKQKAQNQAKVSHTKEKRTEHNNAGYNNNNNNQHYERSKETMKSWDLDKEVTSKNSEPFWKDVTSSYQNSDLPSYVNENFGSVFACAATTSNESGRNCGRDGSVRDNNNWNRYNDREWDKAGRGEWVAPRYCRDREKDYNNRNYAYHHRERGDWGNQWEAGDGGSIQIWDYSNVWQVPPQQNHNANHHQHQHHRNYQGVNSSRYGDDRCGNNDGFRSGGFGPIRRFDYHAKYNARSRPY